MGKLIIIILVVYILLFIRHVVRVRRRDRILSIDFYQTNASFLRKHYSLLNDIKDTFKAEWSYSYNGKNFKCVDKFRHRYNLKRGQIKKIFVNPNNPVESYSELDLIEIKSNALNDEFIVYLSVIVFGFITLILLYRQW